MTSDFATLSVQQLRRALALKAQSEKLSGELNHLLGGSGNGAGIKRSSATRARMAAAQRARWTKVKRTPSPTKTRSAKRVISAAGRVRMAAAAKARWAAAKMAGKRTLAG
jgi:hypothetical protein